MAKREESRFCDDEFSAGDAYTYRAPKPAAKPKTSATRKPADRSAPARSSPRKRQRG